MEKKEINSKNHYKKGKNHNNNNNKINNNKISLNESLKEIGKILINFF
jgi:hypothetical protein